MVHACTPYRSAAASSSGLVFSHVAARRNMRLPCILKVSIHVAELRIVHITVVYRFGFGKCTALTQLCCHSPEGLAKCRQNFQGTEAVDLAFRRITTDVA